MSKSVLPPLIANPNLFTGDNGSLASAYDAVVAKSEKYITPRGIKGRTTVFSRISPDRIKGDRTGTLYAEGTGARQMIEKSLNKTKAPKELKAKLLDSLPVQIKGNISRSSTTFFSANQTFPLLNKLGVAEAKRVRFVDAENSVIPQKAHPTAPVRDIVLPELPPETE